MLTSTVGLARLSARNIALRPGRAVLVATASVLSAALVVAAAGILSSLTTSLGRVAELAGVADVQVVAAGDTGIPTSIVGDVTGLDGVEAAAPIIRTVGAVDGHRVLVTGADPRLAAFVDPEEVTAEMAGAAASLVAAPRDGAVPVVIGEGLASRAALSVGDEALAAGGTARTTVRVVGTLDTELNGGQIVVALLDEAAAMAGKPGRADEILVKVTEGVEVDTVVASVRDAVGGRAVVTTGAVQVESVNTIILTFVSTFAMVALLGLALGAFVVNQTVQRVTVERRRELATLLAVGGTPGPLLVALVVEMSIVSSLGGAVGTLAGIGLGRSIIAQFPTAISSALGAEMTWTTPTFGLALAVVLSTGAAALAALMAGRSALEISPTDAMRPADVHGDTASVGIRPILTTLGLGAVLAGTAATVGLAMPERNVGVVLVVGGTLVALRGLLPVVTTVATTVASRFGAAGPVAAESVARAPARVFTTTAAIAIAVALASGFIGGTLNTQRAARTNVESLARIDVLVATAPANEIPLDFTLPDSLADEIAALDEVATVEQGHFAASLVSGRRIVIEAIEGDSPPYEHADPSVRDALLSGEGVVVSRQFDTAVGASVGETLRLVTPTGTHDPVVLDIAPITGFPGGSLYLSTELFERWYERDGWSFLAVRLVEGADAEAARTTIRGLAEDPALPVHVLLGTEQADASEQVVLDSMSMLLGMVALLLVGAALVTLNTFVLLVLQRRRELGVLRAIGASPATVRGIVVAEVAGTVAGGAVAGLPLGALLSFLTGYVVGGALGFDVPFLLQPAVPLLAVLAAVAVAIAGSVVPARRAARVPVVEAIGYE